MASKDRFKGNISINNRKAGYEYEFLEKFTAGMVLKGTEIKSIREGRVNLQEAFCVVYKGEIFVREMHISPYSNATHYNHELTRERKLLLNKKEIEKLESKTEEKGLAIVPVKLFINEKGLAKMVIALGRGKKLHDKRQSLKEKDLKREIKQADY